MSNYKNTIIYKIFSKDTNIKDCYIGHTTHLELRKYHHYSNSMRYPKRPVYKFINANGGFRNWDFEIISKHELENKLEAEKIEEEAIKTYNATLNYRKKLHRLRDDILNYKRKYNHEYFVCNCGSLITKQNIVRHRESNKHKKLLQLPNADLN